VPRPVSNPQKHTLSDVINRFVGSACRLSGRDLQGPHDSEVPVLIVNPAKSSAIDLKRQGYDHIYCFVVLPSRNAPRWLFPLGDHRCTLAGTKIYTPYARRARLTKSLLERVIRTGWNGWAPSQVLLASRQPLPIEILIREATGEVHPHFALSLGNQPAVRKLTVQVMRPGGEILGYLKLPLTSTATERVRHEAAVLEKLWNFPVVRPLIPRLLHAGSWEGTWILFQSALPGELGPTNLTRLHENFLAVLRNVHQIQKPGRAVVEELGKKWERVLPLLGNNWKELGQEVLRRSARELDGQTIVCGVTHGDFAPWNTRIHDGKILAFDWESSDWEAPGSWDVFHFDLQSSVSLKKPFGRAGLPSDRIMNGETSYLLYLLYSVTQFVEEDNSIAIDLRHKLVTKHLAKTSRVEIDTRRPDVQRNEKRAGLRARPSVSGLLSNPTIVTTSWDDGDPLDIKIAELLGERRLAGTFYIPMSGYLGNATLTPSDLRALSARGFEIGAHGVSHNSLTLFAGKQLEREVRECKHQLEDIVGKEVPMFCYPNGRYNPAVVQQVRFAGYHGARTTRMLARECEFTPFEIPTTLHAHPHDKSGIFRNLVRAGSINGLYEYALRFSRIPNWVTLGKKLFDSVLQNGGMWHLYGHSWEIEQMGIWEDLREMLNYVSNREGVMYVTNCKLLQHVMGTTNPEVNTADQAQVPVIHS